MKASVSFALYTGDSETVARTLGEPVEGNELTRRDDIRRNPPDIILTNYKQLEFLLVRKTDRALFTPAPDAQHEIRNDSGELLTIPDFAYLDRKIAIYCDGFAYHGNVDALAGDARKRNALQASSWAVLTFWGRQILRNPGACEAQIWQCYQYRRTQGGIIAEPA